MSAPIQNNHTTDDLHKSNSDGSPMSSILSILMLLSVLAVVIFMFKDQIKEWLGKNKKDISLSDDDLLASNDDTPIQETVIELPIETTTETTSNEIKFEIEQPNLTEGTKLE